MNTSLPTQAPPPPLQAARIRLVEAMEHLDRVFSHSGNPAAVQVAGQAVKDAADNYADTRRESPRRIVVAQPTDGRDMEADGYTQITCPSCNGSGRVPGVRHTVTCGRCSGYGHLFERVAA